VKKNDEKIRLSYKTRVGEIQTDSTKSKKEGTRQLNTKERKKENVKKVLTECHGHLTLLMPRPHPHHTRPQPSQVFFCFSNSS